MSLQPHARTAPGPHTPHSSNVKQFHCRIAQQGQIARCWIRASSIKRLMNSHDPSSWVANVNCTLEQCCILALRCRKRHCNLRLSCNRPHRLWRLLGCRRNHSLLQGCLCSHIRERRLTIAHATGIHNTYDSHVVESHRHQHPRLCPYTRQWHPKLTTSIIRCGRSVVVAGGRIGATSDLCHT